MIPWQEIIVWSVVIATILAAARWMYRAITNPRSACRNCDQRHNCNKRSC